MSNNHVGGGIHEPAEKTMAFYDALPPAMRQMLLAWLEKARQKLAEAAQ